MATNTEPNTATALQRFNITDAAISKMREEYLPLKIDGVNDKDGFDSVHKARMVMVKARTTTDKVRKELNAEAKSWIDKVNGEAKRITAQLEPIETHLITEEQRIEAEVQAIRFAKQRAEEEARRQAEEAERARIKAEQEAENVRLAAERVELKRQQDEAAAAQRKAEAELAAQRAAIEESRRKIEEAQRTESARLKAQQDAIDAEKKRVADAEAARVRKAEEDRLAVERAEQRRIDEATRIAREAEEEESRRKLQAALAADAAARADALRPDAEKIMAVSKGLRMVEIPMMSTAEGIAAATRVNAILDRAAAEVRDVALSLAPPAPASESVQEEDEVPF